MLFRSSSVGENVGPQHLVQWVRIAGNKAPGVAFPDFGAVRLPQPPIRPRPPQGDLDYSFDWAGGRPSDGGAATTLGDDGEDLGGEDIRAEIRQIILEELRAIQNQMLRR